MKKISFIAMILLQFAGVHLLQAQVTVTKSTEIQIVDGTAYYIHEVLQGQTLYSISTAYQVPIDKIKSVNRITGDNLQKGFLLKIPVTDKPNDNNTIQTDAGKVTVEDHTVVKGESLYKIALTFNTSIDNLKKINPGINENIAIGQVIKVPVQAKKVEEKKPLMHTVEKGETLYSIAKKYLLTVSELKNLNPGLTESITPGQQIIIGYTLAEGEVVPETKKCDCEKPTLLNEYNVALLIPLYLDKAYFRNLNTEDRDKNEWYQNIAFSYIQFYEGMQMALDTLKSAGMNVNLYVYDLDDSEAKFSKIMENPAMKQMHLILGPFQEKYLDTISRFSYVNKIPMVSCYLSSLSTLKEINPLYFNPVTSISNQMKGLADYYKTDKSEANLIVAYQATDLEKGAAMALDSFLRMNEYGTWKMVNLTESGLKGATGSMVTGRENILVLLANGEIYVENLIRPLNDLKETFKISLFGLPGWLNYENIDLEFLEFQNTHFFSSSFIDYEREDVRNFARRFQTRYKADAEKQAFMGYDISLYFLSALKTYGVGFTDCIERHHPNTLSIELDFEHSESEGFRNKYVSIYRMKDFQLWKVK